MPEKELLASMFVVVVLTKNLILLDETTILILHMFFSFFPVLISAIKDLTLYKEGNSAHCGRASSVLDIPPKTVAVGFSCK
jgi:hypothetical protein